MRLILIDHDSGYIFGDTADMPTDHVIDDEAMRDHAITPTLAARWLDEAVVREFGRVYVQHGPDYRPAANEPAYHVYRADVNGSDAVGVAWDGQDPEEIAAVERDCRKIAVVTWSSAE